MNRARHYFALELDKWLPPEKYAALLSCTVDGWSSFDSARKINTFLIGASKIAQVEQIIGRQIRIVKSESSQVDIGTVVEPHKKWKLDLCANVNQQLIIVTLNRKPHPIPFEYVDFVWSRVSEAGTVEPREVWRAIEKRLQMQQDSLYQDRGNYYTMYYWPVVALKALNLIGQEGTGPLCLTQTGASCADWRKAICSAA